jgi:hypothetical protein
LYSDIRNPKIILILLVWSNAKFDYLVKILYYFNELEIKLPKLNLKNKNINGKVNIHKSSDGNAIR